MDMKLRRRVTVASWAILLAGAFVSCTPAAEGPIALASFTENYVDVSIHLEQNAAGNFVLSATFTPPVGYHLYSKDIPITGVNGLGRPTLLELTTESQMQAMGNLIESAKAETPAFEPKELLVYPAGAVTLRLPVKLTSGNNWIDDEVAVTYMACSASLCKPPVMGKVVPVRVPGADMPGNE